MAALAPRLRAADVAEVWAAHRALPEQALAGSLAVSDWAGAGVVGGRVEALFGVAADAGDPHTGIVWLLASPVLEAHPLTVLRYSRMVVDHWQRRYRLLTNWVDARNRVSLRWLRWLGFTVFPAVPYGPDGERFHRVEWRVEQRVKRCGTQRRTEACVQYRE
ncbi:hypothetical protein [Novispirillum itersonii]|uniref:N-acetyltransferase domain-containing protein n=1 Tax=Novispirillum itersonii TaxID=189 RepID=A0A7W9ZGE7_NOVIT|nr:hypothetical protein [Novispirillum itersonii]MBB6211013.1 hypothetical protein [Novispirillum itersonii]